MRRFCTSLILGSFFLLSPVFAAGLSEDAAREFCEKTWFPRLRLGRVLTPAELQGALDSLLELYTPDVEFVDPNNLDAFGKETLVGKTEVRAYYRAVLPKYPVWEFTILEIHPTAKGFVLRYEGRNAPPVAKFEGVDLIELREENGELRISKLMGYYDRKPFFATPPTPPGP